MKEGVGCYMEMWGLGLVMRSVYVWWWCLFERMMGRVCSIGLSWHMDI